MPFAGLGMLLALCPLSAVSQTADDSKAPVKLEEAFDKELSKEWFWGLGTWTARDGILRGFESGPRRHGPVKMRRFAMKEGMVECEFRLIGKAKFAGVIFNGAKGRGHIVHLVIGTDQIRILAHPKKDEVVELVKTPQSLAVGEWHRVRIVFQGDTMTATLDDQTFSARHACLAETKLNFGLGGDSGGPTGEEAGALEFRKLQAAATTR